ncbi:VIT1/CCC1 transporter family protein [Methanocella sp. MCL-LM]|uniref:VIT1/CCC1 transporter family protein n=1 Tax=Methanocella sp. MCL-LM TaxID=3412035 RepID=UPI003C783CE6
MANGNDVGRYLILGSIDGLLAILGIIVGLATTTQDAGIILKAALGGGIALCLTNGIGSYLAETAVEYSRISSVEKAMLEDLRNTRIEKMARRKIVRDSIIHGGASLCGSIVPILPFLVLRGFAATASSVGLSLAALVVLGLYSGKVSSQSYLKSVVRMVGLGALIVVVCSLLGIGH